MSIVMSQNLQRESIPTRVEIVSERAQSVAIADGIEVQIEGRLKIEVGDWLERDIPSLTLEIQNPTTADGEWCGFEVANILATLVSQSAELNRLLSRSTSGRNTLSAS